MRTWSRLRISTSGSMAARSSGGDIRRTAAAEAPPRRALLRIGRALPRLRAPARFDAWSYRLLVRACYAEGRSRRRWAPSLRLLPSDESAADEGLGSVVGRGQLGRGFRGVLLDTPSWG